MIRAAIAFVLLVSLSMPPPSDGALAQQDDLIFDPTTIVIVARNKRHRMRVQVARSLAQLTHGLMFRKSLKPYAGMLFDFGAPITAQIWMKNTYIPLDIIFIDADGRIESIAEGVPESLAIKSSRGVVRAVLELRKGAARRLGIAPGDTVRHEIFGNAGEK